jgi:multidrug efflux pump
VLGWLYVRLPTSFLPDEDQGYVIANIELPSGSSSNRTVDIIKKVEHYFMSLPQVANVVAVQGFSFNGNGLNAAIAFVPLKDFSQRKGPGDSAQAISGTAMGKLLFGLPDSMVISITPPAISSLGNASGFDMRLEDRSGVGHDALEAAAQQLLGMAAKSPILAQTRITGLGPGPELKVQIDRAKAAALGVDFSEAASIISTAIGSSYVGKFTNQGWVQNIWVQADEKDRMNPDDILRLNARNASGEMVPLSSFVNLTWTRGPVQVVRYNGYESVRIGGSAAPGYSTGQAMAEMEKLVAQLPPGLSYEWTGLSYQEVKAGNQSAILLGLSVLVVFMVLAALYESWAIPLSVMLAVPLGMLGAVLLSSLMGKDNDVYFQVGMVTVIGLAAKNAILIVEFAKDLYASGAGLMEAAIEAARLRFRPILMTSFAFILGVVPLVIATGAGAASQNAVGLGVMGGMLAATPLAVIFVPTFFVVILRLFRSKPKLLGHQAPHIPSAEVTREGEEP